MTSSDDQEGIYLGDVWACLKPNLIKISAISVICGIGAYGVAMLIPPTYTARTTIISPQQQQNSAASALAALGGIAGLAGSGLKSPSDQYIGILQSATVSNRIIEQFNLKELYETKFLEDARKTLAGNVRVIAGKKDNLITIEVDDKEAVRAADIANSYVKELRWVTNNLALTEAQQRRSFFEQQLVKAKDALARAQVAVEKTGFTAGALKSEPKAAAETYARTKAEVAATEVKLGALRKTLADSAPEVQQLQAKLGGLRSQLTQLERPMESGSKQDYVSAYREYKYQEALFEIYAKQFELAKMDEAREGMLIQVLDPASTPERRTKPRRTLIAAGTTLVAGLLLSAYFVVTGLKRRRATSN